MGMETAGPVTFEVSGALPDGFKDLILGRVFHRPYYTKLEQASDAMSDRKARRQNNQIVAWVTYLCEEDEEKG